MHLLMDGIHIIPGIKGVGRYALNTVLQFLSLDDSLEVSLLLLEGNACSLPRVVVAAACFQ